MLCPLLALGLGELLLFRLLLLPAWQLQQLCRLFDIEVMQSGPLKTVLTMTMTLLLLWYHSLSSDIFRTFLGGSLVQRVAWTDVESSFGKVNETRLCRSNWFALLWVCVVRTCSVVPQLLSS